MPVNSFADYPMSWKPERKALGKGPLYLALAAALEADVSAGRLPPGTKLPPQRELADYLDIDFTTVTRAYGVCKERNLVYGVTGRGTFVAAMPGVAGEGGTDVIDLGVVQSFPEASSRSLIEAAQRVLSRDAAERLFSYDERDGKARHREAGRRWLERCGVNVAADDIAVFPGIQSALSAALLTLFRPGDKLAVDQFTYSNLIQLARLARMKLVPIASGEDGMIPEALAEAAEREGVKGVFLMPNCANPTAITLDGKRRDALAAVADRFGLLVLEDDMSLSSAAHRPIHARIPDRTLYLAGSARLVAPGLRIAAVAVPDTCRKRLLAGFHHLAVKASALEAEIAGELVLSGAADRILRDKADHARRANRIFDTVFHQERWGDPLRLLRTMPLPGTAGRGQEIEHRFLDQGLRVFHSDRFRVGTAPHESFLRVSVSSAGSEGRLQKGLVRLRELAHTVCVALFAVACLMGSGCSSDRALREAEAFRASVPADRQDGQADAVKAAVAGDLGPLRAVRASRAVSKPLIAGVCVESPARRMVLYGPEGSYPAETVIYLHGGCWTFGGIPSCADLCMAVAKKGVNVLVLDYPLAPEYQFPAALDATVEAYRWAVRNCGRWGGRKKLISMAGDSAGGNLVLAAALKLQGADVPPPRALGLIYPVVSAWADGTPSWNAFGKGYGLDARLMEVSNAAYAGADRQNPLVSPSCADDASLARLPPCRFLAADRDILRDQGLAFHRRLKSLGVDTKHETIPGSVHLFATVPGQPEAFARTVDFIADTARGE